MLLLQLLLQTGACCSAQGVGREVMIGQEPPLQWHVAKRHSCWADIAETWSSEKKWTVFQYVWKQSWDKSKVSKVQRLHWGKKQRDKTRKIQGLERGLLFHNFSSQLLHLTVKLGPAHAKLCLASLACCSMRLKASAWPSSWAAITDAWESSQLSTSINDIVAISSKQSNDSFWNCREQARKLSTFFIYAD